MKRNICLIFCAVLLAVSLSTAAVSAAATPQIVCQDITCAPGERITVDVIVSNNPGFAYLEMTPVYSPELTLVEVTNGELISDFTKGIQYVWVADEDVTADGLLMTFTFDVAQSTPMGEYCVDFIVRTCANYNEQLIDVSVDPGKVIVGKAAPTALDQFTYDRSGSELTITGYIGSSAKVIIADTYEIDGEVCTVTAIGIEAFVENETIISLTTNAGLKLIDEAAFWGCVNLSEVTLNEDLETIGVEAFYNCESLLEVTVPGKDTQLNEVCFGYVQSGRKDALVDGFKMIGYSGSTAETYANENEISFQAIELAFAGASVTLYHNLAVNFKVDKALFEEFGFIDPYVVFAFNGATITVTDYTVENDRYVFAFRNIAPNQMNDTIVATLYAAYDGDLIESESREYSVAAYCYGMLEDCADDQYAQLRTLLVDMLHYGAAAQTYTGYKTDVLVNADLTEVQLAWGTATAPTLESVLNTTYKTVDDPEAAWKGAGLYLEDSVTLRLKFASQDINGLTVRIEADDQVWEIPSSQFVDAGNHTYYVYFNGLGADQMRKPLDMTVCKGSIAVSNTARYSIESYASEQQNSDIIGLADLLQAMMKYGDSAYAYVNEGE